MQLTSDRVPVLVLSGPVGGRQVDDRAVPGPAPARRRHRTRAHRSRVAGVLVAGTARGPMERAHRCPKPRRRLVELPRRGCRAPDLLPSPGSAQPATPCRSSDPRRGRDGRPAARATRAHRATTTQPRAGTRLVPKRGIHAHRSARRIQCRRFHRRQRRAGAGPGGHADPEPRGLAGLTADRRPRQEAFLVELAPLLRSQETKLSLRVSSEVWSA
jgi:hypothetical protein